MTKPFGKFVQVGLPSYKETFALDHLGLVFFGRQLVGSIVCSKNEYLRMLKICAMKKIVAMSECFPWEEMPKAFDLLANGKPHFRCVVEVGDWARKNGFHKKV
jgi:D-arabinose 1-dehydrogenase-like Zn-dependent alcohol dehydrogenase